MPHNQAKSLLCPVYCLELNNLYAIYISSITVVTNGFSEGASAPSLQGLYDIKQIFNNTENTHVRRQPHIISRDVTKLG